MGFLSPLKFASARETSSPNYNESKTSVTELTAIIVALRRTDKALKLRVFTDSQYALDGIKNKKKPKKNLDLWCILLNEIKGRDIIWAKVKAHENNFGNICADILANYGALRALKLFGEQNDDQEVQPAPWLTVTNTLAQISNVYNDCAQLVL